MDENKGEIKVSYVRSILEVISDGGMNLVLVIMVNNKKVNCELGERNMKELYDLLCLWSKIKEMEEMEKKMKEEKEKEKEK